jgi:hypothetical protein
MADQKPMPAWEQAVNMSGWAGLQIPVALESTPASRHGNVKENGRKPAPHRRQPTPTIVVQV